ncbi:MAG: hypothetical protein M1827_000852 [Pycnora praestabilis]|nr:MAG: hypothetical protein M1827_000852 [Pycnora praestabilis]
MSAAGSQIHENVATSRKTKPSDTLGRGLVGRRGLKRQVDRSPEGTLIANTKPMAPKVSAQDELLRTLKSDFDGLRSVITCRVCVRLLYEPYTIGCGHTFCYSCLCQWFVSNKYKKTCPDCRSEVTQQPAPAYLVREMTELLINRAELMPDGETTEEHRKWQREESEIVERDKTNIDPRIGGLFRGSFKPITRNLRAIRDEEDGVDRCPLCTWELEDGLCGGCGLRFDDHGQVAFGNGFGGFSEMDDGSDPEFSSNEDLDEELDMEDQDSLMDANAADWNFDYFGEPNYAIRRAVAHGAIAPPRRRLASHSAAGSQRQGNTISSVSEMQMSEDGEMDTVEEEDGDEDESEDDIASLNSFIDDDEDGPRQRGRLCDPSSISPNEPRPRQHRRGVRVVLSESLSSESQGDAEVDDEDFDEGGAVSNGRRRRSMQRPQPMRQLGRRGPIALSISSGADEEEQDPDEETQYLLNNGWSPLVHDENAGITEIAEDDTMTAVELPPSTLNERTRLGGAITPTLDTPSPAIRQPLHTRRSSVMNASRGLRRKNSILPPSAITYEDGEADDDDSDAASVSPDRDGDIQMGKCLEDNTSVRKDSSAFVDHRCVSEISGHESLGTSISDAIHLDSDSISDRSIQNTRSQGPKRARRPEYNPRISMMFAQHQHETHRDSGQGGVVISPLGMSRCRTLIARPRTANRNRSSQQPVAPLSASPFSPLSNFTTAPYFPPSPGTPRARGLSPDLMGAVRDRISLSPQIAMTLTTSSSELSRPPSVLPLDTHNITPSSTFTDQLTCGSSTDSDGVSTPTGLTAPMLNDLDPEGPQRATLSPSGGESSPASLGGVSAPPAVNYRESSQSREVSVSPFQMFHPTGTWVPPPPGLNFAARSMQARNPWAGFVRSRNSNARLREPREQSSTATLRARASRREIRYQPSQVSVRDTGSQTQPMGNQASRTSLRSVSSYQRLRGQGSTQALRTGNTTPTPRTLLNGAGTIIANAPNNTSTSHRLSDEERRAPGCEMARRRAEELGIQNGNPFTAGRSQAHSRQYAQSGSNDAMTPQSLGNGLSSHPGRTSTPLNCGSAAYTANENVDRRPDTVTSNPGLHRPSDRRNMGISPRTSATRGPATSATTLRTRSGHATTELDPQDTRNDMSQGRKPITAGVNAY